MTAYKDFIEHRYGPCMVAIEFGKYCDRYAICNRGGRFYLSDWKPTIEEAWKSAGRKG